MMPNFFPQVCNFTVDAGKVLLQFLLVTFALGFIHIACRSMRIVEKEYNKTSKKIKKLKTRMDVVLAHSGPICQHVLYYNVIRYRHSLIANYLKDLIDKENEPQKFSNFFNDFPESSSKQTSTCSIDLSEKVDSLSKLTTKKSSYKKPPHVLASSMGENFREKISQNKYNHTETKVTGGRKNDFRVVKSPLESKIFKTIEGQNKRVGSSIFNKRKPKISKRNLVERKNENLTSCNALNSTRTPFKVKTHAKFSTQKLNTAPKSSYTIKKTESLSWTVPSTEEENKNTKVESKNSSLEDEKIVAEISNIQENCSVHSIGSSGGESDNESDCHSEQCPQTPLDSGNVRQNIPLTTINEESAEENCVSE